MAVKPSPFVAGDPATTCAYVRGGEGVPACAGRVGDAASLSPPVVGRGGDLTPLSIVSVLLASGLGLSDVTGSEARTDDIGPTLLPPSPTIGRGVAFGTKGPGGVQTPPSTMAARLRGVPGSEARGEGMGLSVGPSLPTVGRWPEEGCPSLAARISSRIAAMAAACSLRISASCWRSNMTSSEAPEEPVPWPTGWVARLEETRTSEALSPARLPAAAGVSLGLGEAVATTSLRPGVPRGVLTSPGPRRGGVSISSSESSLTGVLLPPLARPGVWAVGSILPVTVHTALLRRLALLSVVLGVLGVLIAGRFVARPSSRPAVVLPHVLGPGSGLPHEYVQTIVIAKCDCNRSSIQRDVCCEM